MWLVLELLVYIQSVERQFTHRSDCWRYDNKELKTGVIRFCSQVWNESTYGYECPLPTVVKKQWSSRVEEGRCRQHRCRHTCLERMFDIRLLHTRADVP